MLGERLVVLEKDEGSELDDGETAEDGSVVLLKVFELRIAVLGEITPVHVSSKVVGHMVIFAKVVIITLDNRGGVNTPDVVTVLIEVDERVEGKVHESKEEGHADLGLEVNEEEE